MALVTLLEYLTNKKLKHNLVVGDNIVLHDVTLNFYEINTESCWIHTDQKHEVKLDLTKFKKMTFDAAVFEATNSVEMIRCIIELEEDKPYNAYLETANGGFIAGFYRIGK
ncbi:hypothetical protein [Paenisporosarcina sp. OV554]|uniref:hypothetical protein n=1 Tax=Paenisporosarcina sp. OV554 TaxID=2135694 RepID=UPI000D3425CF|nr:hypothetical protein [Paenisporosarcina sp. OV554]PUB11125.1 hypothetical protein C8K15_1141 [Paenisporosarcina sp. OV554]